MGLYDEELSSDILDVDVFEQIQACDEDDERSFSRELIIKYFAQALATVPELNKLFVQRDLANLSKRGHFLKSSSAVIGIRKIRNSCELVQTYAAGRVDDRKDVPESETIPLLEPVLKRLPNELQEAQTYLCSLYGISDKELADAQAADESITNT